MIKIIFITTIYYKKYFFGDIMALENNNYDLSFVFIGTVLGYDVKERTLDVYLPKLMPSLPSGKIRNVQFQTSSLNITGYNEYKPTITARNTIKAYPHSAKSKIPAINSKVVVYFIDANPKRPIWTIFDPFNSLDIIDEEKYSKLFNININGTPIEISEEDSINFELDDKAVILKNDKDITVKLSNDKNYIQSRIMPKNPNNGLLWFNESNNKLYLYKNDKFHKVLDESDLKGVHEYIKQSTKTINPVTSFTNLTSDNYSKLNGFYYLDDILYMTNDKNYFQPYTEIDDLPIRMRYEGIYYLKPKNKLLQAVNSLNNDGTAIETKYSVLSGYQRVISTADNPTFLILDPIDGKGYWSADDDGIVLTADLNTRLINISTKNETLITPNGLNVLTSAISDSLQNTLSTLNNVKFVMVLVMSNNHQEKFFIRKKQLDPIFDDDGTEIVQPTTFQFMGEYETVINDITEITEYPISDLTYLTDNKLSFKIPIESAGTSYDTIGTNTITIECAIEDPNSEMDDEQRSNVLVEFINLLKNGSLLPIGRKKL